MEKTNTIIEDKMEALRIAKSHMRTFACVGGVICHGIDENDLQDVIDEMVNAIVRV